MLKIGPFTKVNFRFSSKISLPKISEGIKSGVNWILLKFKPNASETVCTKSVFAKPGTPINKECPPQKIESITKSTALFWPTIIFDISFFSSFVLATNVSMATISDIN